MAKSGYSFTSEGEVALAAAGTAKTILGCKATSDFGIDLCSWWVDFDSVTAADKPVKIQLLVCSFATNAPGTNSTSVTVKQNYGRLAGTGISAAKSFR